MLVQNGDDCLTNLNWLVQPNNFPPLNRTPPLQCFATNNGRRCDDDDYSTPSSDNLPICDYKKEPVKPPYSYAQLITMAMEAHGGSRVLLTDIYAWIKQNFAFFKTNDTSWQNSVRHNLSLNKQFVKVPRDAKDKGKGSYWMLDPRTKDPYCLRRRNFNEPQQRRSSRPEVSRPQVNPAVKTFLETNLRLQECRRHPFAGAGERLEDIGAQECVYADADPTIFAEDFNQKLFKKEVESYDPAYEPNMATLTCVDVLTPSPADHDPRVRVEYLTHNWDLTTECYPSGFSGAKLPTEPSADRPGYLDIPSPSGSSYDPWSQGLMTSTTILLSPSGGAGNYPLAKVFENLNNSNTTNNNNNITINNNNSHNSNIVINFVTTPNRDAHPWLDRRLQEANLRDGDILDLDSPKLLQPD